MENLNAEQVIDILDKMDFFEGQRAGRELWNDKPFEMQEQDIANFSRDVALIKKYINSQEQRIKELANLQDGFEKLVHCSECKHGQQVGDLGVVCEYGCEEYRPFDHFCAWGERRDFASDTEDE